MEIIRQYIGYVNILLACISAVLLIVLLVKAGKMGGTVEILSQDSSVLGDDLRHMNETIEKIQATKDSWMFFGSLYVIIVIIRETLRYHRSDKTITKSLARSVARHAKELSSIRL